MTKSTPTHPSNSPVLVPGLDSQLRYVDACRADPAADKRVLHKKFVADPHWTQCVAGGELEKWASIRGLAPVTNVDALATAIAELKKHDIDQLVRDTFVTVTALLPGPTTTVWILAGDPEDPFTVGLAGGVNGTTVGTGRIWLHLVPLPGWKDRILAGVAHEYHHSVFLAHNYKGEASKNLLNYLIMEGEACVFTEILAPNNPQPWTQTIPAGQERQVWEAMLPHLDTSSEEIMGKFIFGYADGLPPMCGYGIGYAIVKAYLARHPAVGPRDWTIVEPRELLAASGYAFQSG